MAKATLHRLTSQISRMNATFFVTAPPRMDNEILIMQGTNQHQIKICFKFVPGLSVMFLAFGSSLISINNFLHILDNFQNAYLTLHIRISAR